MTEAPEGIVLYSFTGLNYVGGSPILDLSQFHANVNLFKTKKSNTLTQDQLQVGQNAYIDFSDVLGKNYKETEKLALSRSFIETMDLISEGEVDGPVSGTYVYSGTLGNTGWTMATFSGYKTPEGYSGLSWFRSIYWNEVPVLNDNGQFNFQNIDVAYTNGLPNGAALQTLVTEETSSRSLNERLRGGTENTKYYRILNPNCRGIVVNVKVAGLNDTNPNNGDIRRSRIDWNISYRPLFSTPGLVSEFSNPQFEIVFGKITSAGGYVRSTRVDFNTSSYVSKETTITTINDDEHGGHGHLTDSSHGRSNQTTTTYTENVIGNFLTNSSFIGWEVKIVRTTEDSVTSLVSNTTYLDSITELYGNRLRYPCSAIVRNTFNAEFFSSIPERAFHYKLLKVKVPGNYDPITRSYANNGFATTNGYWDGTFATGKIWTDNPAWCYYDLLTNTRYGLGKFIESLNVDKFTLYKIGQYCDELVPDGIGGLEPRFSCNVWVGGREDAFKVVNDFASIFRGMSYYAFGTVYAVQDSPKSPRTTFTNANVENGDFTYSSISRKVRQSIAIVRYNDPKNFYKPAIEYVEDIDAIRKYGIKEVNLTAFGCTSRGQAIRLGNWTLLSNNLEPETIQFTAGLEATSLRPGDVFKVFDFHRKWKRYGGRVETIENLNQNTGALVTLDGQFDLESNIQYTLSLLTPTYYYDSSQISGLTDENYQDIRKSFLQNFNFSGNNTYTNNGKTVLILSTGVDNTGFNVSGNPVFTIELGPNSANYSGSRYFIDSSEDYYRVLSLSETDVNKYQVIGVQYSPEKFLQIDSGLTYARHTIDSLDRVPSSPHDLALNLYNFNSSRQVIQYAFLIDDYKFINSYKIYATTGNFVDENVPDESLLAAVLPADILQGNYLPTYSGDYTFRVYSYNEVDNLYSNGCASGTINYSIDLPIRNIIINGLKVDQ